MGVCVSVVIPTYNDSAERLEKTINSVLAQSFRDFEVVVVDDGSREPFGGLDRRLENPLVRWIRLEKNYGVAHARNEAIRESRGTYIAFLDAGDWWEPEKLERQMELFETSDEEVILVYCGINKHYDNGIVERRRAEKRGNIYRDLLVGQSIPGSCSTVVVTKVAVESAGGFYDKADIQEDRDLWLKVSRIGNVDFLPEPLSNIEVRAESRSMDVKAKEVTYRRFIEMYEDEIREEGLIRQSMANYYHSIAAKYFSSRQIIGGVKNQIMCFIYLPSWRTAVNLISGILRCALPGIYWGTKKLRRTMAGNGSDEPPAGA